MRTHRQILTNGMTRAVLGLMTLVLVATISLSLVGASGLINAHAQAPAKIPRVLVIDGDSVQTADGLFDLYGIDAPELGQRCQRAGRWISCGQEAAFALHRSLGLALAPLVCTPVGDARSPRSTRLATCAIGDKQDLAIILLSQGLALAAPDSPVRYKEAEESARAGTLGIWATDFVRPSDWRKGRRLPDEPLNESHACPIKAFETDLGERLYMVPLDPGYDSVSDVMVEAHYCSDEAAEADGWERPPLPAQP